MWPLHILLFICIAGVLFLPTAVYASDPDLSYKWEYEYEYPDARSTWESTHSATGTLPPKYEELRKLPEGELRKRIDELRIIPEEREWPVHESPKNTVIIDSLVDSDTYTLPHPTDWWVSAIDQVNNSSGNYSEIHFIPEIGMGDTIHIRGIPGHTYKGGFTISADDITICQWKGSSVQPQLTSPATTTPAITITADNVTLFGLNICNTSVTEGNGAGVTAMGANWTPLEQLTIDKCTFSGNNGGEGYTIPGYGGGLYAAYINHLHITECTFSGNSAGRSGGGAYIQESNGEVTNCTFTENFAELHGGGAYFDETDLAIRDTEFTKNRVDFGDGGGFAFHGGDTTLTRTRISSNTGKGSAGGAYFHNLDTEITDCFIFDNSIEGQMSMAGGVYFSNCNATLSNTTIESNSACSQFGGGGYFQSCDVALINTSIHGNTARYNSGGACFSGSTVRMTNTSIDQNIVDLMAGGALISGSDLTMKNSAIEQNYANRAGGADIHKSNVTLINSSLSKNRILDWEGGGAIVRESHLVLENSTISNNYGFIAGGGLYCINSFGTFENTSISENHASFNGGAIYCEDSSFSFTDVRFINNSANEGGSDVLAINCSEIHMNNAFVKGQDAEIACAKTAIDAENITFDAYQGNTTTISCIGKNIGLGTAPVPSPDTDGNKTIRHALAITGINTTGYPEPANYTFSCNMKIHYLDTDLGKIPESLLTLFCTDGAYWEEIPNATVNTAENYISAVLTETELPESVVEVSGNPPAHHWNWTTLVPAGPESGEETISLSLKPGWNMISTPFTSFTSITVPDEVTLMYSYDTENGIYVETKPTTSCPCNGYWIGATAPSTLNITGIPLTSYQQNLSSGWNMIGCLSKPISVTNMSTTPETPVSLYRYNVALRQYETITTSEILLPGEGYWAGVHCCCELSNN